MSFLFNKFAATLVLLLSIVLIGGTVSQSFAFSGQEVPVQCCDKEHAPEEAPAGDGECSECGCLTCSAALEATSFVKSVVVSSVGSPQWRLLQEHPSDHIRSIDYPPEVV